MLYESLLLFGVVFVSAWIFDTLSNSRHALMLRHWRQAWLFFMIGAYFVFFWHRSGQTLAMKTWQIRAVSYNGARLTYQRAVIRYALAWMMFLPAALLSYRLHLPGWQSVGLVSAGWALWVATALNQNGGQFLHDRLAGTRLIHEPKQPRPGPVK